MTKLPETKKVSLDFGTDLLTLIFISSILIISRIDLMQKSVTSFSRKGVDDRGDVSGWTSTLGEEPAAPQVRKY